MSQNGSRGRRRSGQTSSSRAPRRAYDQTRDTRRTQPARRRQKTGYQEKTIEFTASGPQPSRRADNSIQFPQQTRAPQSARSQAGRSTAPRRSASPPPSGRLRPTQQPQRSPARRESKKKRRLTRAAIRRRRFFRRLTAFALLLCVIAAGAYLTVTMLFKISAIRVETADGTVVEQAAGYSSQSILQALEVHLEENIFSFEPDSRAQALERQFPLLESIRVVRKYPGTVVVQVTEAVPTYAIQSDIGWLTLSEKLKILALNAQPPQGLTVLYGGTLSRAVPGEQLSFAALDEGEETAPMERLNSLRQKLTEYQLLADVTRIEFADGEQLAFLYQDRISVLLGTLNELDYKLKLAQYVLFNRDGKGCAATDTGLLDLSHLSASTTRKFRFAQGEPVLPSGYQVPSAEPEPEADPAAQEETAPAEPD